EDLFKMLQDFILNVANIHQIRLNTIDEAKVQW
ncbi:hypothetical protein LCGC14_2797410, partial [marine sediment metagenome]